MSIRRREKKQKQKPLYDKKQPVHVVHFKLNERGGGLQAAIVNYSSQVDLGDMSAKQLSSM